MTRWSPRELPHARRQSLNTLHNMRLGIEQGQIEAPPGSRSAEVAEYIGRHIALLMGCEMYWATPEMTALAVSAGRTLPEVCWADAHRPSVRGLMVWDGGAVQSTRHPAPVPRHQWPINAYGVAEAPKVVVPFSAVSWAPHHDGTEISGWTSRHELIRAYTEAGYPPDDPMRAPVLAPAHNAVLPAGLDPQDAAELVGHELEALLVTVAAAWQLMQQPTLAERTILRADRADARRAARAGYSDPDVTIVDLRRLYHPRGPGESPDESSRVYSHRWVVSGHWRQQPFGKDRALRRQQWIPSHVKGPDGTPLLETERVNVWRR
jgi:hypothetical protein